MALRLKWWGGGMALACLVIALGYLPPRGSLPFLGRTYWRERATSPATERRNELAAQWQSLRGQVDAARLRVTAEPLLDAERRAGRPPWVVVVEQDSSADRRRPLLQQALESAWQQLGMGETKIAVVLGIPALAERYSSAALAFSWWRTYILPDSTDRTTCVVVYPGAGLDAEPRIDRLTQRIRTGLGPCAFYARFGAPSARLRHWLDANFYDVAEGGDWSTVRHVRDVGDWDTDAFEEGGWYGYPYFLPFDALACAAGRSAACLSGWKRGEQNDAKPFQRVIVPGRRWRTRDIRLPNQGTLLASLVREVGDDAFQTFWTTSLPIDSALTIAVEQPAAEWLTRRSMPRRPIRLGPVPPLSSMIEAVVIAGALLAIAAVMVSRRQVR
jgi:hypothetical protein